MGEIKLFHILISLMYIAVVSILTGSTLTNVMVYSCIVFYVCFFSQFIVHGANFFFDLDEDIKYRKDNPIVKYNLRLKGVKAVILSCYACFILSIYAMTILCGSNILLITLFVLLGSLSLYTYNALKVRAPPFSFILPFLGSFSIWSITTLIIAPNIFCDILCLIIYMSIISGEYNNDIVSLAYYAYVHNTWTKSLLVKSGVLYRRLLSFTYYTLIYSVKRLFAINLLIPMVIGDAVMLTSNYAEYLGYLIVSTVLWSIDLYYLVRYILINYNLVKLACSNKLLIVRNLSIMLEPLAFTMVVLRSYL